MRDPVRRVAGIKRHVGPARLEDPQGAHQQIDAAGRTQPNRRARFGPHDAQNMRQPVRAPVQRGVAERFGFKNKRWRVRRRVDLRLKCRVDCQRIIGALSRVPRLLLGLDFACGQGPDICAGLGCAESRAGGFNACLEQL